MFSPNSLTKDFLPKVQVLQLGFRVHVMLCSLLDVEVTLVNGVGSTYFEGA